MNAASLSHIELLTAGCEALSRGEWAEAATHFKAALEVEETPEAFEGLSTAASWLDDGAKAIEAREHAYRLYREREDWRGAARTALWLAFDYVEFRDERAIANGWLGRARRLLKGHESSAEHGWLLLAEGHFLLRFQRDAAAARKLASEAAALARSLGLIDLEMLALAGEGKALVMLGSISEGMSRLDEANAAVVGGEMMDLNAISATCCYLIDACENVRDFERAAQWCSHMKDLCQRWQLGSMFAICRSQYASVLIWRGDWSTAEMELEWAAETLNATRPNLIFESIVRLAELRHQQGRLKEAAELFTKVESQPLAQPGRAALALDQNQSAVAVDIAERFLRHLPPETRTDRAAALELLARAHLALGNYRQAKAAAIELGTIAAIAGTDPLRASVSMAEGWLATATGDHDTARRQFEDAVVLFERNGAPFETARARVALARSLFALGRVEAAIHEARAAQHTFQSIGAVLEAERATILLRELESPKPLRGEAKELGGLSRREREIASLIAQGHSNRKIADLLVVSERTVETHVSNILSKLGFNSRSQIAAWAAEKSLAKGGS